MNDRTQLSDSSKKCLETALSRIAGAWKAFDTNVNGPVYRDEIRAMIAECGEIRVERGITTAIRADLEFLPSPGQLWEYVRNAARGGTLRHPDPCELCGSTTWVEVEYTTKQGKTARGMKRCPNWRVE
jgi:hypothetical protein